MIWSRLTHVLLLLSLLQTRATALRASNWRGTSGAFQSVPFIPIHALAPASRHSFRTLDATRRARSFDGRGVGRQRGCFNPMKGRGYDVDEAPLVDDDPSASPIAARNVIVTGANRGLGYAIAERMAKLGHRVVLACRSKQKGHAALKRLQLEGCGTSAFVHELDVTCSRSLESFRGSCIGGLLGGKVDILFNNAGVCLAGEGHAVFKETLAVNFFGALDVIEACLPAMEAAGPGSSVVWISSGDGELCYLSSKWQGLLRRATTLEEIKACVSDLSHHRPQDRNRCYPEGQDVAVVSLEEVAFGPTPAYSLSKAAANAAVRVWGARLASEEGGVRLVAVCPGDVLTRIASEEQVARAEAVQAEEAAMPLVEVALRGLDFPAGRFYRHEQEIPW